MQLVIVSDLEALKDLMNSFPLSTHGRVETRQGSSGAAVQSDMARIIYAAASTLEGRKARLLADTSWRGTQLSRNVFRLDKPPPPRPVLRLHPALR